jgi:predicted transcriptional regulator
MRKQHKLPKLSRAELKVYRTVIRMSRLKKYELTTPTLNEIAAELGVSYQAVQQIKKSLVAKGYAPASRKFELSA